MKNRGRRTWGWALGLSVVLALLGGVASAKKPQPPPPPPPVEDPGDVGVIYARVVNALHAAEPDGSSSYDIQLPEFRASIDHYPSRGLYGGERWFLQKRITKPNVWLPDGMARYELYAVSEGGKSVLLFSEDNYDLQYGQYLGSIGWTAHDGDPDSKVSFVARKWVEDPDATNPDGWSIGEAGIYVATLDPQDLPAADGALDLEWSMLPLEFTLNEGVGFEVYHEWAPDGMAMVYKDYFLPAGGIWLAEDYGALGWTTDRLGPGDGPRWSNDGTRLAFRLNGDICIMDRTGSNVTVVVPDPEDTRKSYVAVTAPFWSPSDTHLVHTWMMIEKDPKPPGSPPARTYEIRRVLLTEDGGVNSLKIVSGSEVIGWRE